MKFNTLFCEEKLQMPEIQRNKKIDVFKNY